jgi:hypothetical protein
MAVLAKGRNREGRSGRNYPINHAATPASLHCLSLPGLPPLRRGFLKSHCFVRSTSRNRTVSSVFSSNTLYT